MLAQPWYCARESGFWLYTSPEEWKAKYPGVAETLDWIDSEETRQLGPKHQQRIYHLNARFDWIFDTREQLHNLYRVEETVVDTATGEVMARDIDFFRKRLSWFLPAGTNEGCYRKEERDRWRVDGKIFMEYKNLFKFEKGK